ncbi:hypothetical protein A9Q89_12770 [Gammaproteobacteria bacterium 53_120_T64]|nr:hypothetical protein A9Q89_12770 [Gammaproteobacteria bacterium 53_120_T64]
MAKVFNKLNNRWVIGIIGVIALSALVWFGASYIKFGDANTSLAHSTRWIIIALIFFTWLTLSLVRWGLEQRQNAQLMDGLEEEEASNTVDPTEERSVEELDLIKGRFKEALAVLKKSRFKTDSGSKTLYQLPWYIIIGPPGAGKTTALINSGLNFPLAQSHGGGALSGVGGTRHCDWWFTNDAVLIDTAGRYTTQDSHQMVDKNAWAGFLKLLKKYRPRRPINGAIVAISLQELMAQTADQRQHHAITIRSRIDELQAQLGVNPPIYLMFTKCDLVAGFNEFFANFSQAEREQVWGMTFTSGEQVEPAERFALEYRGLMERLNQRLLGRIDYERNLDARSLIHGFPERMETLAGNLQEFIATTFAANAYHDAPTLRGAYFTSATQEGSPIDRMMSAVSANFGLPRSVTAPQVGSGKSFFLKRLLNDVIFPEAELVGSNHRFETLLLWGRRASYGALALLSIGLIVAWTSSITGNRGFMKAVAVEIDSYQQAANRQPSGRANLQTSLQILKPLHRASSIYAQNQHPWLSGLGLYDGRVDTAAKALYQDKLGVYFLPQLSHALERELASLKAKDPRLAQTLAVYLMLDDESRRDAQLIKTWGQQYWHRQFPESAEQRQQLQSHLDTLLSAPLPAASSDPRLIERTRLKLSRVAMSQRLYQQLQNNHDLRVDLYSEIGGDSETVFGIKPDSALFQSSALYTKAGFNNADYSADSELIEQLHQSSWIYGDKQLLQYSASEREELSQQIERAYLSDYTRHWQTFLKQLNIAPFRNLNSAVETLGQLSDPSYSPLLTTLELVAENTRLRPALPTQTGTFAKLAGALPDSLKPTLVDKQFRELQRLTQASGDRPAPSQQAIEAITEVKEFMDGIASDGNPGQAAYQVVRARFVGATNPLQKLRSRAGRSPQPMQHWLEQIADNSWRVLLSASSGYLNREWQQQVYKPYQNSLANRYPLAGDASEEASLADFSEFFGPDGIEHNFFKSYLASFIDTRKWQLRSVDGRRLQISNQALEQLRRAHQVRKAYYAKSEQLAFNFRLQPSKLDGGIKRFTLELGNGRLSYSHGPQLSKTLNWIGGEHDRARLLFEDLNGDVHRASYDGDWAWLHLLDAAQLRPGGRANSTKATFSVGSRKAQYLLSASSSAKPFNSQLLHGYRCPQRL